MTGTSSEQMSSYQFVNSLTSCYGQSRPGGLDASNSASAGIGNMSSDYYSSQAAYNSCYGSTASPASYAGYLSQNGDHHSHHHSHHSLSHSHPGLDAYSSPSPVTGQQQHQQTSSSSSLPSSSSQYREYSSESVPSSHHPDLLSDCAVIRGQAGVVVPPGSTVNLTNNTISTSPTTVSPQYTYLEPSNLMSKRQKEWPGTGISPYSSDVSLTPSFSDITCSQLNGSPYHFNPHHLASQLHHHHQPHHHSHLHHHHPRGGLNAPGSVVAPVTTYKWMQVKRNVPKPGMSS